MRDRYTIIRSHDCIVIEGAVPVNDLVALMRVWEKREVYETPWIVDALLSAHMKCNMVLGPPDACATWRKQLGIAMDGPPEPARVACVAHEED